MWSNMLRISIWQRYVFMLLISIKTCNICSAYSVKWFRLSERFSERIFVMLPQARWLLKKSKGFFKKQMASFKDIKVKSSCIYSVHSKKRFFQGFVESFEACYVIGVLFFVEVGWSSGSGFCCVWIRMATWLYFVHVTQYSWWGLVLIEMCPAQWVTLRNI